jgi:hypothetical protein
MSTIRGQWSRNAVRSKGGHQTIRSKLHATGLGGRHERHHGTADVAIGVRWWVATYPDEPFMWGLSAVKTGKTTALADGKARNSSTVMRGVGVRGCVLMPGS